MYEPDDALPLYSYDDQAYAFGKLTLLCRLWSKYLRIPRDYLVRAGNVSWREVHLLTLVSLSDGLIAAEAARQIKCTPSAIAQMVPKLEKKGLLRRCPSEDNGKQIVLRTTPEGEALVGEYKKDCTRETARMREALRDCSDAEICATVRVLDSMIRFLAEETDGE